jgi:hypothetical protein
VEGVTSRLMSMKNLSLVVMKSLLILKDLFLNLQVEVETLKTLRSLASLLFGFVTNTGKRIRSKRIKCMPMTFTLLALQEFTDLG